MSCVTAVEGEWLAELGPHFFSIKESFETTLKRRQQKKEEGALMEKEMALKEYREEKEKREKERRAVLDRSEGRGRSEIATPGRHANSTPRFMPKKRGRLGL